MMHNIDAKTNKRKNSQNKMIVLTFREIKDLAMMEENRKKIKELENILKGL